MPPAEGHARPGAGLRDGRNHRRGAPDRSGAGRDAGVRHPGPGGERLRGPGQRPSQPRGGARTARQHGVEHRTRDATGCGAGLPRLALLAGCASRRMKRWRSSAPTVFRPFPLGLPPVRSDAGTAADLLGYPAVVKLRDSAAPADRLPNSLVFDLHDASHIVAAARVAFGPSVAARRDRGTAGAAPCRTRARGCGPGVG